MRKPLHIHRIRRESRGRRTSRAGAADTEAADTEAAGPALSTAETAAADGPAPSPDREPPPDLDPPAGRPSPHRGVLGRGDAAVRDRLARALIDEAYGLTLHEAQQALAEARDRLAAAHREVSAAERELERTQRARVRWRRWRRIDRTGHADRLVALRALTLAQVADLADTDVPPGEHLTAVREYLRRRHPPRPPLDDTRPPTAGGQDHPGTAGSGADELAGRTGPAPGSVTDR